MGLGLGLGLGVNPAHQVGDVLVPVLHVAGESGRHPLGRVHGVREDARLRMGGGGLTRLSALNLASGSSSSSSSSSSRSE